MYKAVFEFLKTILKNPVCYVHICPEKCPKRGQQTVSTVVTPRD